MIFRLFKKKPNEIEQLRDFVSRLSILPPDNLGIAIATIEHTANTYFYRGNFYTPQDVLKKNPEIIKVGLDEVRRLKMVRLEIMSIAWMAWVHTFRAVVDPNLMPLAKNMWSVLAKGAPHAKKHATSLVPLLGFELDVDQPDRIPVGFS